TKWVSRESGSCIRLITTSRSKPSAPTSLARKISAIPPSASLRTRKYLPNRFTSGGPPVDSAASEVVGGDVDIVRLNRPPVSRSCYAAARLWGNRRSPVHPSGHGGEPGQQDPQGGA